MATREERAASNQTVFRAANEALRSGRADRSTAHTFICECGDEACMASIELTYDEYEGCARSRTCSHSRTDTRESATR